MHQGQYTCHLCWTCLNWFVSFKANFSFVRGQMEVTAPFLPSPDFQPTECWADVCQAESAKIDNSSDLPGFFQLTTNWVYSPAGYDLCEGVWPVVPILVQHPPRSRAPACEKKKSESHCCALFPYDTVSSYSSCPSSLPNGYWQLHHPFVYNSSHANRHSMQLACSSSMNKKLLYSWTVMVPGCQRV